MLQALLVNRFKLAIHHETKKLPIYALVVAKSGLNPGHPKDYYTGAAGISIARRSTRIVGTTLMFGTAWLCARRSPNRNAYAFAHNSHRVLRPAGRRECWVRWSVHWRVCLYHRAQANWIAGRCFDGGSRSASRDG